MVPKVHARIKTPNGRKEEGQRRNTSLKGEMVTGAMERGCPGRKMRGMTLSSTAKKGCKG